MEIAIETALVVFADTNVLLHYEWPDDLPWDDMVGTRPVRVLIAETVVDELDQKKNLKIPAGQRARKIASRLGNLLQGEAARANMRVEIDLVPISPELPFPASLKADRADHRLLHEVLRFQAAHPGTDFLLLTADLTLMATARRVGVPFMQPPDSARRPLDPDARDEQLQAQAAEIAVLSATQPVVAIAVDGGSVAEVRCLERCFVSYAALEADQIALLLDRLQQRHPRVAQRLPGQELLAPLSSISDDAYSTYARNYAQWLDYARDYLRNVHFNLSRRDLPSPIELTLYNNGNVHGETVRADIRVAGACRLRVVKDYEIPPIASPPAPPESPIELIAGWACRQRAPQLADPEFASGNFWLGDIHDPHAWHETDDELGVAFRCKKWRHQSGATSFRLQLLPTREPFLQAPLGITVTAANLRRATKVNIPLHLNTRIGDTYREALQLIELVPAPANA